MERTETLRRLLAHLDGGGCPGGGPWHEWQIARITGGRNNLLYRATGSSGDFALKFTIDDARDRAGREYGSLSALRQANLPIAPEPILLDRTSYTQPVMVQTWLGGEASATPPATMAEWQSLLQHPALVHTIMPGNTEVALPYATIVARDAEEGKERVRQQMAHIPPAAQPPALRALLQRFEAFRFPDWPKPPITLCRLDNNATNFVRRPGLWASVDWEYSGWGDVANLITHVAYKEVSALQWPALVDAYNELVDDATVSLRIQVYGQILVVWWAARLARYLYELPLGLDQRLAAWSPGWQADIEAKYDSICTLPRACMSSSGDRDRLPGPYLWGRSCVLHREALWVTGECRGG